jgi:hypothetical protein
MNADVHWGCRCFVFVFFETHAKISESVIYDLLSLQSCCPNQHGFKRMKFSLVNGPAEVKAAVGHWHEA